MADYNKMNEEQILADMAKNTFCMSSSSTIDKNYMVLSNYIMKDYETHYDFIMNLRADVLISILHKYDDFTKIVLNKIISGKQSISWLSNGVFSVLVDKLVEFYGDDNDRLLAFFVAVKNGTNKLDYDRKMKAVKKRTLKKLSHILTLLLF